MLKNKCLIIIKKQLKIINLEKKMKEEEEYKKKGII